MARGALPHLESATSLSDEDRRLIRLLATGQTDQQVAHRLGWGLRTVQRRVSALMSKLDAPNRFVLGFLVGQILGGADVPSGRNRPTADRNRHTPVRPQDE